MPEADQRLLDARDLALAALAEITPADTVGPPAGYVREESGAVSLKFENRLPGYPGWFWTVTVAQVDDEEPAVLELELLPGDGALLAPEWIPWAERMAEYRAQRAQESAEGESSDDDEADLDDEDADDGDDLEVDDLLDSGDVDGVDIDELDEAEREDDAPADEPDSEEE